MPSSPKNADFALPKPPLLLHELGGPAGLKQMLRVEGLGFRGWGLRCSNTLIMRIKTVVVLTIVLVTVLLLREMPLEVVEVVIVQLLRYCYQSSFSASYYYYY